MPIISAHGSRTVLLAASVYFAVCGLSALCIPISWLWASGLPTEISPVTRVTFGVIGAYLCALAVGAMIARSNPRTNRGLTLTLAIANLFDFVVTLQAIISGQLPALNGGLFVAIAMVWATLLTLVWQASRRDLHYSE